MTETTADVICDAGPVIHLDELSCLELLVDFPAGIDLRPAFTPESIGLSIFELTSESTNPN